MRKNCLVLFIFSFALFFISPTIHAAETLKIGIFDLQKVIRESKTIEGYRQQLRKVAAVKDDLYSNKQNTLRQADEKLKKDGPRLQADERKSLEEQIQKETKELQRMKEDMDLEMKKAERELTEKSLKGIDMIINQIYEKEKYSIILETNTAGVIKCRKTLDITDKVLKAYDTK